MKITEFNQNQKKELLDYLSKFKDIKEEDVNIYINFESESAEEVEDVECIIKGKKCIVRVTRELEEASVEILLDSDSKMNFTYFIEFLSKYNIFLWGTNVERDDNGEDYFYKKPYMSEDANKAIYNQKIVKKIDELRDLYNNIKDDMKKNTINDEIIKLSNQVWKNYVKEITLKCDSPVDWYMNSYGGSHQYGEITKWIDKVTSKEKEELTDYFKNELRSNYDNCEEYEYSSVIYTTWPPGAIYSLDIFIKDPLEPNETVQHILDKAKEQIIFNNEESV